MTLKSPRVIQNEKLEKNQKCGQKLTPEGRIQVSRRGWLVRTVALSGIFCTIIYNLYQGIFLGSPLLVYSTLMPIHAFLLFTVGWIFFKSRTTGKVGNALVSVIIPVFNQESMIETVIGAIFSSTYKNIEVIAVNDGSRDNTKVILEDLRRQYPNLKVIHKKNEGKRKAVAAGFYVSKGDYIVLIDSDSVVDKEAISEFMKTFNSNSKLGAVVGYAKVWNAQKNILTKCQDAWYDYAFNIHKTCESTFGCVLCCSGCLAGYRREAIANFIPYWIKARIHISDDRELTSYVMATPWAKGKFAPLTSKLKKSMAEYDDSEDRALTAQALEEWKTVYVPSAVVYTEVPDNFKGYIKQQTRWKKGYMRSNLFVSAFFWKKNPLISLIFYIEFMVTFTAPLILFTVYFYIPFVLNNYWIPPIFLLGQILIGLAAGLDYKCRDPSAKNWKYKPLMNLFVSFVLSWLIFPALWTFRKNQWLTR